MKKILLTLIVVAVAAIVSIEASAQAPAYMSREKSDLYLNGMKLTSDQVFELIGEETYDATYRGAIKQYKAGLPMMIVGGVVGFGGLVLTCVGSVGYIYADNYGEESTAAILMYSGLGAAFVGDILCAGGAALFCIGRSRLGWVASDYNRRQRAASRDVTLAPASSGFGLALKF